MSVQPILVYGTARSGTTRLANLILGHADVAGLAHPLHWGTHEIPLYDYRRYWGDFDGTTNYQRFRQDLRDSDIARLAGLAERPDDDSEGRERPRDVYEWFAGLMHDVAAQAGARYWVTKLDPKVLHRPAEFARLRAALRDRYDDVHFVVVERPREQVVRSYLDMPGASWRSRRSVVGRLGAGLLGAARGHAHARDAVRLLSEPAAQRVAFEDLVRDPDAVLADLQAHIGTLGHPEPDSFPTNTSFSGDRRPAPAALPLTWRLADRTFGAVPGLAGAFLRSWERRPVGENPLYYRLRQAESDPGGLEAEFLRSGHDALIPLIPGRGP